MRQLRVLRWTTITISKKIMLMETHLVFPPYVLPLWQVVDHTCEVDAAPGLIIIIVITSVLNMLIMMSMMVIIIVRKWRTCT